MNNPGPNQQLVVAMPQNKYPCRVAPCMDSFRQKFKRDCHEAVVHSQGDCFLCQCGFTAQGNSRFISHLNGAQRHQREVARSVEAMKQNGILPDEYFFLHTRYILKNCEGFVDIHGDYVQHYARTMTEHLRNNSERILANPLQVMQNICWREFVRMEPNGDINSTRHGTFNVANYYDA